MQAMGPGRALQRVHGRCVLDEDHARVAVLQVANLIGQRIAGVESGGNGAVVLDLGPWMTTGYTSNAGIPSLVSALNTLLAAGQLSSAAQSQIIGYVANTSNFAYGSPPTATQMRDRVRAVVHLAVSSPDFIIQK